jgi:histone deacetylase 1/2
MVKRVVYFTDIQHRMDVRGAFSIKESKTDMGSYSYNRRSGEPPHACGESHLMDPQRLRYVHALVLSLGLKPFLTISPIRACSIADLRMFHSKEYVDFLQQVTHEKIISKEIPADTCLAYNIGPVEEGVDCTAFDGLLDYTRLVAGASLDAAYMLRMNEADIAINWAGGLHHAKRSNAAGFCYINDCVLAIVELLKTFDRVLYIDIDFHHGDGVEEAFYITDRVFTLSLHRFSPKKVFPGTGDVIDGGWGPGTGYCVNFPLLGGVSDDTYVSIFKELVGSVMQRFDPSAIVLQAGADSLVGDSVGMENGSFNLSTRAHAECVRIVRDLNKPLLVLGGGGYSILSVARCWAINTAILCGKHIDDLPATIPEKDFYFSEYGSDKGLHVEARKDAFDFNTPGRISMIMDKIKTNIAKVKRPMQKSSR